MGKAPDRARWRRIDPILDHALELSGEDRERYVAEACAGDADLEREVRALLRASTHELEIPELPRAMAEALDDSLAGVPSETPSGIGPFQLRRSIGQGGMGEVFEAVDPRLDRRVAIKLLTRSRNREASERFLREARAASALDHPNICTVYDVGETKRGQPYLVMAYYPGETLEQKLSQGPLAPEQARKLALGIARGLDRAHQAGIVHRDVKPANVVFSESGEPKILDFGIARMLGEDSLTRTGTSPGTPAYMAPEQVRGETVDERTDVWSLGVMLYEMLCGERPFRGEHPQAVTYAILHHDPPAFSDGTPEDLERIVRRALARDPTRRYGTMAEMVADLEGAPEVAVSSPRTASWWAAAAAVVLVLAALAIGPLRDRGPGAAGNADVPSPAATPEPSRLAVFRFHNLSQDPELDWLSGGIAEMVSASLAQSTELRVLGSSLLARRLRDLDRSLSEPASLELAQSVAEVESFDVAILGSFARAGEELRVVLELARVSDGEVLRSAQAHGDSVASLFRLVDELTAGIRNHLETEPVVGETRVWEITTESIEAWRLYTEAIALHDLSKREEAVVLFEKAVEIDPGFALALAALGKMYGNLGRDSESREILQRAVDNAERLPLGARHQIVGAFYATRWSTLGQAISSFQEAVRRRPEKETPRNNLARVFTNLERYPEAVREYRELINRGTRFPGTYTSLANTYAGLGQFETGYRLLRDFSRERAASWSLELHTGWFLTEWGKLDEALARFAEAERLRGADFYIHYARWRALVLRGEWAQATTEAELMAASNKTYEAWRGAVSQARNELWRGRSNAALRHFGEAIARRDEGDAFTALARCWRAEVYLARGEADAALSEARRAMIEGAGEWPALQARFLAALAQQQLGNSTAADQLLAELRESERRQPNAVEERQIHHLEGVLAVARGEVENGLAALRRAAELLPPRGVEFHLHVYPQHVAIWHDLGKAELAADRPERALVWLQRLAASGAERLESPLPYVRGLELLGECHRRLGDEAAARRVTARTLDLWRDGDLDRRRVTSR